MIGIPIFLVEKAAGLTLEQAVPMLQRRTPDARKAAGFCRLYRRIAIARLLSSGTPGDFFTWLVMGAQAFLHWASGTPEERKIGSLSHPFFDAVAAGAHDLARAIAAASAQAWRQGEEYEDDFLYLRFLMDHLGLRSSGAGSVLDRLETLAEDGDPRVDVCRALLARDGRRFANGVEGLEASWLAETREAAERDMLSPDDAATTAHVSTELLALLEGARLAGLPLEEEYRLAPSNARRLDLARLPGPDAWRDLPRFRQLA